MTTSFGIYFGDTPGDPSTAAGRRVRTYAEWLPRWAAEWDVPDYITKPEDAGLAVFYTGFLRSLGFQVDKENTSVPYIIRSFYQDASEPRLAYTCNADITTKKQKIYLNQLYSDHVYGVVKVVSESSVNVPCYFPVAAVTTDGIRLRNLALIEATVASSGCVLDISEAISGDPPVEDSPIWVANYYGDILLVPPDVAEALSYKLLVPAYGPYRIRYESQNALAQLKTTASLCVNNNTVIPSTVDLNNAFDDIAAGLGLRRNTDESNCALRKRMQCAALSVTPAQFVSSALGLSSILQWDTDTQLTVDSVGNPDFPALPIYARIEETPYADGPYAYLSREPLNGLVNLYRDNNLVSNKSYTIVGRKIIFADGRSGAVEAVRLRATYRIASYTITTGSSSYTVSYSGGPSALLLGVSGAGVTASVDIDTRLKYVWGSTTVANAGIGRFDGQSGYYNPEIMESPTVITTSKIWWFYI